MALTKNDIVERLQVELGFTKSKSIEITECLIEQIKASHLRPCEPAQRAGAPRVVNWIGDHTTLHLAFDAPLQ